MGMFDWIFINSKQDGWGQEEDIGAEFQTKCLENKLHQYEIIDNEIVLNFTLDGKAEEEQKKIDYSGFVFIYAQRKKAGVPMCVEYKLEVDKGVIKKATLYNERPIDKG